MKKLNSSLFIIIILCLVLLSVVGTSIYRQYRLNTFSQCNVPKLDKRLVAEWLNALKTNNPKQALLLASKMVPTSFPYAPLPYYFDMASQSGIGTRFFNPPFTMMDYLYWKDSYNLHRIAKSIVENSESQNVPKNIFLSVLNRIKRIKQNDSSQRAAFLSEIWKNKQGDILDKYFLFSELMLQVGYDVQTVVLFPDIHKAPVHIIAEIRGYNKVYTCDFFTGQFWNKSVAELKKDKTNLAKIWKNEWIRGLDHLLLKAEISAMSYRKINQQLHNYLLQDDDKNIPVLGLDPYKMMVDYQKEYYPRYKSSSKMTFILGIEPFTMIKNSKFFPKVWLLEKDKKKNNK